ncbi:methyltransferase family protein [Flavobacterium undicola]|uniref:methyltransferase family protein n=1 Tax=Flavobacterium undicola TaxID=1932779 RepID=UPI0013770EC4|nr:isoprenylcysteine carboxylmethyltransferase family protein [Flavobacterium undicola]MBA0882406.1 isoprenylcysteine carboxylmethyltransferase family protein [Flavobacterium undicola]
MDIKLQTIIYFSYLYGFFEIFMSVRQRLKRKQDIVKSGDKSSIWILFIFIGIGYFLSFMIGFTRIGRIYNWDSFFAIGAILAIIGLLIRIISILTLKQHFTYTVTKIDNHELIDTGLYKNIRHPGYLGQLIIFFGISIAFSNWISMILMMLPVLIGYLNRIRVEEIFLIEQMGQKYLDYQERTKRLIPMIY